MNRHFNLYYLHWWTLTHFIFEDEKYRENAGRLLDQGGTFAEFERLISPVERVELEWHAHVQKIKRALAGDVQFHKTGKLP